MARFSPDPHSRFRWVFWGFMAVGAFFVLTEHTAHVLGILPYLLVLACPLMHLFMHHGHGHEHSLRSGGAALVPSSSHRL